MEDSISQPDDQAKFIVLPSQEESQQTSQIDNLMTSYLKNLPALQDPDKNKKSTLGVDPASDTADDNQKGKILVPESEYESERSEKRTYPSDYISDSENESEGDTSNDNKGEVTVIKKPDTDQNMIEPSNPSSPSSFQSRNRSNLGSYDQCEVYRTQSGHAKGDKFRLIASSQADLFDDDGEKEGEGEPVSTPAEHLGSLHLSQKPMLVPETLDESGDAIPPSPDVYGSTPIIIPSSPTQDTQDDPAGGSQFDVNAASTLAENSKGFDFGDTSDKENSPADRRSVTPDIASLGSRKSPLDLDAALQMSTLVDEEKLDNNNKPKGSKRLQPAEEPEQGGTAGNQAGDDDRCRSPVYMSQDDVIVIGSETMETQPGEQSEGLYLQLSLTQESTMGQKSQVNSSFTKNSLTNSRSEDQSKNAGDKVQEEPQHSVVERTSNEHDLEKQNEGQGQKRSSQGSQDGRSHKSSQGRGPEYDTEVQNESQKWSSQGSDGQKSNKSGSGSDKSQRSQRRKEEKRMAVINDNPIVIWKEESDTDQFHLSLPKEGSLIHPDMRIHGNQGHGQVQEEGDGETSQVKGQMERSTVDSHRDSVMSEDSHQLEGGVLAAAEIPIESEPLTQPTFQLHKPALADIELSQDTSEQLFSRSSPRQGRTKQRFILEDDSDDDDVNQTVMNKPNTVKGKQSDTVSTGRLDKGSDQPVENRSERLKDKHGEKQEEKLYTARKLDLPVLVPDESADATQSYDATEELVRTSTSHPAGYTNTADYNDTPVKPAAEKSTLVQSSTQTLEPDVPDVRVPVDINVVQKVAEYLTSSYTPRSRSSSTCTDLSDLQGSEKTESTGKGSTSKLKRKSSSSSRKDSTEKRSPKSPKEIQEIINTYTSILNRRKSSSQCLSRQTSVADSVESSKDREGRWLPQDKPVTPTLSRLESKTPHSQPATPAATSSKPRPEAATASVTPKSNLTTTQDTQPGTDVTPKTNIPARKDLSIQYSGVDKPRTDTETLPAVTESPSSQQPDKHKPTETSSHIGSPVTPKSKHKPPQLSENDPSKKTRPDIASPHTPKHQVIDIGNKKDSERQRKKHHSGSKHKAKKLLTASDRSERRRSVDSSSPRLISGSFVESTQKFTTSSPGTGNPALPKLHKGNTFDFHGTQSQISPEQASSPVRESPRKPAAPTSYAEKTPLSSRKRSRLQHKPSRLKKTRLDGGGEKTTPTKHHVSFKPTSPEESSDQPVSQKSNLTTATIGSMPSLPSTISSPTHMDYIMSPSSTSSGSRQSVMGEPGSRLSAKRMSIEQVLPDTIPLQQGEEDNYQLVTVETSTVKKVYTEIITTKKIIGPQGHVLENTVDVTKSEPTIMEETTHKRMQYVYMASPSRSAASLTSGDLADISSSLSKSSVSSGSLGSKVNSLNRAELSNFEGRSFETQTSLNQSEGTSKGQGQTGTPGITRKRVTDTQKTPAEATTSKLPSRTSQPTRNSGPQTPVDPEVSVNITPLGSTIDKTGGSSYLHSRTTSMESPKASSSLFTSPEEKSTEKSAGGSDHNHAVDKPVQTKRQASVATVRRQTSSGEETSSEIPYQDQAVSSSSPNGENTLVSSSGVIGCRVMAKWRDGFFYPGNLKSTVDRYGKCYIKFDDGTSMYVRVSDILLIERLPVGQSVMVLTDDGDFVYGLITGQQQDCYTVSKDEGSSDEYTHSQVILSGDQAACIISDAGNQILLPNTMVPGPAAATGAVSLDNLLDAPRRSAKKQPLVEVKPEEPTGSASTSKGRKRKIDELKPKATSTPTPKGKQEMGAKRRKVIDVNESPIGTPKSSPVTGRKPPRKARDRLFKQDIGPIPSKKLFRGMTFLLTNVERNREQMELEKKLLRNQALETSTDESSTEDEIHAPFDKDHLKAQIEAGGGVYVDTLDNKLIGRKKCYLVSSSYQRTIKYLQCLAAGIPCMSHMWLVDSCTQGQLLDEKSYILPNGVSLERKSIMEWKSKKDVFIGVKASVYSKNSKFVETWSQILSFGQCKVYKQLDYREVDVIVTDNSCTPAVKRQATSQSVALVSTEWVLQSLINSKTMAYDGHARYQHDFS